MDVPYDMRFWTERKTFCVFAASLIYLWWRKLPLVYINDCFCAKNKHITITFLDTKKWCIFHL